MGSKTAKKPPLTAGVVLALPALTAKPSSVEATEVALKETHPPATALEAGLARAAMWCPLILAPARPAVDTEIATTARAFALEATRAPTAKLLLPQLALTES